MLGIIPAKLADMSDALRYLGNLGAHATEYHIDKSEVSSMDGFFTAMLEYVYVGSSKLDKLKKSIENKNGKKI